MLIREAYGEVLRAQRIERHLTLRQLAKKSCVSLSYIWGIEHGLKDPSSEILQTLCKSLDMSVEELLAGAVGQLVA